jgi:hypothetical protein
MSDKLKDDLKEAVKNAKIEPVEKFIKIPCDGGINYSFLLLEKLQEIIEKC